MAERAHPPFLNYQPKISGAEGGPRPPDRGGEGDSFLSALPAGLRAARYGTVRYGTARRSVEGRPNPRRAALPARASCHRHYQEPLSSWRPERQPLGERQPPGPAAIPCPRYLPRERGPARLLQSCSLRLTRRAFGV